MNRQELKDKGFECICSQNSESRVELWAKLTGYENNISYIFYLPENDTTIEETRSVISYTKLNMFSILAEYMQEKFIRNKIPYNENHIWKKGEG